MAAEHESHGHVWRARLGRRLSFVASVISPMVLVPILLGTTQLATRLALVGAASSVVLLFLWLARTSTPTRLRSFGVVAGFTCIGVAGYATVGFLSAPGIAFALAVASAGLLLGWRAMLVTVAITAILVAACAILMVRGIIPAPTIQDISPELARPWLRSSAIMLLLIVVLGSVVTWSVGAIEATLAELTEQAHRRQRAEAHAFQGQRRELMVRLAGGLAHDINNQLTVIASSNSLLEYANDDRTRERSHRNIGDAVATASELTHRLLLLGRKRVHKPTKLSLAGVAERFQATLQGFLPDDIVVRMELEQRAWCEVDEAQIHSALLNLVVNARDAMPTGGTLTVNTARRRLSAAAKAATGTLEPDEWAVLTVSDTGVGMDEDTLRRACEPFFTTKTEGKGSGLGLATIAAIAEQYGGHINIESTPGVGTRVEVWLPASDAATEVTPPDKGESLRLEGVRVLLAEDTERLLAVASEALSAAGCSVVTATDGDEALARVGESPFDILCTDAIMPGRPVSKVLEAFAAANPNGAVLLCSGHVEEELLRRGVERGKYDLLSKPYTAAALIRAIGDTLRRHGQRVPTSTNG